MLTVSKHLKTAISHRKPRFCSIQRTHEFLLGFTEPRPSRPFKPWWLKALLMAWYLERFNGISMFFIVFLSVKPITVIYQ